MTHSPEPWEIEDEDSAPHIISAKKGHITGDDYPHPGTLTDFRRIVACVNACAGIDTKHLARSHATLHIDLTHQKYVGNYMVSGTKEEVIAFAAELLRDEGYVLTEPGDDQDDT